MNSGSVALLRFGVSLATTGKGGSSPGADCDLGRESGIKGPLKCRRLEIAQQEEDLPNGST